VNLIKYCSILYRPQTTWEAQHEAGAQKLYETIAELNGFYVKAAQIIATRGDLFPRPYIDKLKEFSDNVDPMDVAMVRAIITQELLHKGETFEDVFVEFDEEPLGAASIAQVHRAVLSAKYGGREVAIKVQRPSIESKLMGDIQNLKLLAKIAKDADLSPVDYYTIFSELEVQLANEFDFLQESQAMDAIYQSLATSMDGTTQTEIPVVIPRPISGLMSSRVLVMDYLKGTPLTRAQEKMKQAGVQPGSPQSKLMGRKLISALTAVFGRNILETGLFHAGTLIVEIWIPSRDMYIVLFGSSSSPSLFLFHVFCRPPSWKYLRSGRRRNWVDRFWTSKRVVDYVS